MSKTTILYKDVAPGAAEAASFTSGHETGFSDLDMLRRETDPDNIATGELNQWILDGSGMVYDDQTIPFWSNQMSGADCVFDDPPVIDISLPEQYSSLGLSLLFEDGPGEFCADINIKWYQQEELKADVDFTPDSSKAFCQQRVEAFDRITITFRKTNLPYRYVKLRQIIFGLNRTFDMTEIRKARITNQMNHISAELPVSTLNWTLDSDDELGFMFQLKQPIEVRSDEFLIGVYYISEHKRKARTVYDLKCQDALGILDGSNFEGGVYTGYSAMALLRDIVGTDFDIDFGTVKDTTLTGVLQTSSRRAAAQQVLFAWGVCAATDGGEVIKLFQLDDTPAEISRDRTYTGATVETSAIVTAVRVTAHTYTEDENGKVEIGGVKYADTEAVYTVINPDVTANDKQNVIEVKTATMVSPAIGQAVAQRVYDFYAHRDKASAKIVWRGELLGDCVTVPNAWDESSTGNIDRMEFVLSNTVAASCEVIA